MANHNHNCQIQPRLMCHNSTDLWQASNLPRALHNLNCMEHLWNK